MTNQADSTVTLSIHDIIHIRLVGASDRHISYLVDQLGAAHSGNRADPDLTVRFVPRIETGVMTKLGLVSAGFSERGFFVLDPGSEEVYARIPFGELGSGAEIVCLSQLRSPPLLLDLIRVLLLSKDHVAVHAAGLRFEQHGILAMGWAKGGKTGALLAFARKGAAYVGDEWVVLTPGGDRMFGFPKSIGVAEAHLTGLPETASKLRARRRLWFWLVHTLEKLHAFGKKSPIGSMLPLETLERAVPYLRKSLRVWVPPRRIFEELAHDVGVQPGFVFLMLDREVGTTDVSKIECSQLAERMAAVNSFERRELLQIYQAFRFAFPDRRDILIEGAEETERRLLAESLSGKVCFEVSHRYPGDLDDLYEALERVL